jgi:hypothetical protein
MVPQYLDSIFWKILILISKGFCAFDEVVMDFFNRKLDSEDEEEMESEDRPGKVLKSIRFSRYI